MNNLLMRKKIILSVNLVYNRKKQRRLNNTDVKLYLISLYALLRRHINK